MAHSQLQQSRNLSDHGNNTLGIGIGEYMNSQDNIIREEDSGIYDEMQHGETKILESGQFPANSTNKRRSRGDSVKNSGAMKNYKINKQGMFTKKFIFSNGNK